MKMFQKYPKFVPYLYFIAVSIYWFTIINKSDKLLAYSILLFIPPFVWQLIKPNRKLNFSLGITFVCLSSYLILAYISQLFNVTSISAATKQFVIFGGLFVVANFIMALWMIKNSYNKSF